ncbi:MAG: nitronate monooxygenase, partial [Acidimicrobiia bacterium]|nr:nitronate monooxygenase [Acidimicrobiia bacterium]
QGGMGVAVSDWRLARAVAAEGQLGVVSGTGLDAVLVRRLQLGDPGGQVRSAMEAFPIPGVVDDILARYFIEGGKEADAGFRKSPMGKLVPTRRLEDLLVVGSFVEVWLARQGHANPIGINFLEKIQAPTLPAIYGALLAGVGYVLVGAGIPRAIPGILDRLSEGLAVEMRADVKKATADDDPYLRFDPVAYGNGVVPPMVRPRFLAIVSSHVLATMLVRKVESRVDGFVIEGPTAGGHNAPPRGKDGLTDRGEPIYGEKDQPDLAVFRELGLPFWMAGSFGRPEQVKQALVDGAAGVQVGTAFAYCDESGLDAALKARVIEESRRDRARIFTDPVASPTGFPFKVVALDESLSEESVYGKRDRICDLGYLRTAYVGDDGAKGWRCPAEPVDDYVRKGGDLADTVGRKCLCNALMANIGLGQTRRNGSTEPPLVTSGDDVVEVAAFLPPGAGTYRASDVIARLLEGVPG